MKNNILLIVGLSLLILNGNLLAQNPESGVFLSLQYQVETLNKQTNTFVGKGFTEVPTGSTAFVITEKKITVYYDGWMGEDYKRFKEYPISYSIMGENNITSATYDYANIIDNVPEYLFKIVVSNENYSVAFIYLFEDYINNSPTKKTTYKVLRKYITIK